MQHKGKDCLASYSRNIIFHFICHLKNWKFEAFKCESGFIHDIFLKFVFFSSYSVKWSKLECNNFVLENKLNSNL